MYRSAMWLSRSAGDDTCRLSSSPAGSMSCGAVERVVVLGRRAVGRRRDHQLVGHQVEVRERRFGISAGTGRAATRLRYLQRATAITLMTSRYGGCSTSGLVYCRLQEVGVVPAQVTR